MIDCALPLKGVLDPVPLAFANCSVFSASLEGADASVDDDVVLVPVLRDGAESELAEPEIDPAVFAREPELDAAAEPARGADTLLAWAELGRAMG